MKYEIVEYVDIRLVHALDENGNQLASILCSAAVADRLPPFLDGIKQPTNEPDAQLELNLAHHLVWGQVQKARQTQKVTPHV